MLRGLSTKNQCQVLPFFLQMGLFKILFNKFLEMKSRDKIIIKYDTFFSLSIQGCANKY